MKNFSFPVLLATAAALALVPLVRAQDQDQPVGPQTRLYVAETRGESQIQTGEKIYTPSQATAYSAPGAVIETKARSHNALVYSNGTGLFVDESTRVEITRFVQEPFQADPNGLVDPAIEPSVSQSNVRVAYGAVGICTNRLASGTSMLYSTPIGTVNIRGGRLAIEARPDATIVDLLEGDVTVRHNGNDVDGQILRPGERAVVRTAPAGQEPAITIEPIPPDALPIAERRVEMACNARRSVTFGLTDQPLDAGNEAAGAAGDQQIVARPTVPTNPPTNIVISPDRLPGT